LKTLKTIISLLSSNDNKNDTKSARKNTQMFELQKWERRVCNLVISLEKETEH